MEANGGDCRRCEELEREIAELKEKVRQLEAELAKKNKNSRNSSKRPSSDIVKPKKPRNRNGKGRKRGGQKGHPRHQHPPIDESKVDNYWEYILDGCPYCGDELERTGEIGRVHQQYELRIVPIVITEHIAPVCHCHRCNKDLQSPLPADLLNAGLFGTKLTALVAYLKGACHCSFFTIKKFFRDVLDIQISCGQLSKLITKATASLDGSYEQLLNLLPEQNIINVDETGHKDNSQRMWTWCFRASMFTLFKISPSRGSDVLLEVLGEEFDGLLGCDYFSAYRKFMKDTGVLVQFCLAHLIRDVKFLVEHPDARNRAYGRRVLEALRQLFDVIHRREKMDADLFAIELQNAGDMVMAEAIYRVPKTREARNLANRFEKHGDSYLRFITTPGLEPTNNLAEQAIRFVVIDRHITQGSRSESGQRWLERIWTVVATCTQQCRSIFEFLSDSINAHFTGQPSPTLLPDTS